jgi:hypothetical protein
VESRKPLTKVGKPLKKLGKPLRKISYFTTYLIYPAIFKAVQVEIGLSEYGGNKKAIRTDSLLAKHQN